MLTADLLATLGLALGTGVVTFFSPCAYALLPGYVGYYVGTAETPAPSQLSTGIRRGLAAGVGVLGSFSLLLVGAILGGQLLQTWLPYLEFGVGLALIGLGGLLLRGNPIGWHVSLPTRRDSLSGFVGFGALYAVAAAGCVAPFFLAVVLRALTLSPSGTVLVLGSYAAVVASLLTATTILLTIGYRITIQKVGQLSYYATRAGGVLLIAAGMIQLWLAGLP